MRRPRGPIGSTTRSLIQPRCALPAPLALISPASLLLRKLFSQSWLCCRTSQQARAWGVGGPHTGPHSKRSVWSQGKFTASESSGECHVELPAVLTAGSGLGGRKTKPPTLSEPPLRVCGALSDSSTQSKQIVHTGRPGDLSGVTHPESTSIRIQTQAACFPALQGPSSYQM